MLKIEKILEEDFDVINRKEVLEDVFIGLVIMKCNI